MERQYIMVRAMTSEPIHFKVFFENSIVAVGWSDIDFVKFRTQEDLKEAVRERYYVGKSGPKVAKDLNECARFKGLKKGDYIIVPYNTGIALACAEDEERYSNTAYWIDLANQHVVSYLFKDGNILSVPRNKLSEGLQRRLRVPGRSVSDLSEFSEEIDKLFADPENYSYSNEAKQREEAFRNDFKQKLLKNIQSGHTNLQTGGIGMENLIKELFECEGYDARILSKSAFKGSADADIEAWREDSFSSYRLYAQVKHHNGYSGRSGIDQIIEAVAMKNNDGEDCKGLFITTAQVSVEDRKYAEEKGIVVIDGNGIVDIVFENINNLSPGTINKLGIVMVPTIAEKK